MSELKYFSKQEDFINESKNFRNKIDPKIHAEELIMILAKSIGEVNNLFQALTVIHRLNDRMVLLTTGGDNKFSLTPLIDWLSNFNDNNRRKILTWFRDNKVSHKELIRLFNINNTIEGFADYYNRNFATSETDKEFFNGMKLHNVQAGKLLISWMVKGTKVNSDNYYYDLEIGNRKIEVKDVSKRKTPVEEIKIQLIAKSKVGNYEFWNEMGRSILSIKKIYKELKDLQDLLEKEQWKSDDGNVLKKFLKYAFEVCDHDFQESYDSGNFENMTLWEQMYNLYINSNRFLRFKKNNIGPGVYDYVKFISSTRDNKPIIFDVEPIEVNTDGEIPDEITVKVKQTTEIEKIMSFIRLDLLKFKYARNPIDWVRDILYAEEEVRYEAKLVNVVIITHDGVKLINGKGGNNLILNTVGSSKIKVSYLSEEPKEDLSNYHNGILSQGFMKNIWNNRHG